jgi:SAM-dependent methyltransferase
MVDTLERLYSRRDVLRRRELVRAALDARSGDDVLDVGCGPGFYVSELLEAVGAEGSVTGIDQSADMLAVAARRVEGQPNVTLREGSATSLPVADASCDRVLSVQVFEYVDDVPAALRELHRVLRPGGRVVLWDVDWQTVSWYARDVDLMHRVLSAWDEHLAHPSLPKTLCAQMRDAGFDDVTMTPHAFATNTLDPETYGGSLVSLLPSYVTDQGGVDADDATRWQNEQHQLEAEGRFFFSVTQFCFTGTRQ